MSVETVPSEEVCSETVDRVRESFVQLWGSLGTFWGVSPTTARVCQSFKSPERTAASATTIPKNPIPAATVRRNRFELGAAETGSSTLSSSRAKSRVES